MIRRFRVVAAVLAVAIPTTVATTGVMTAAPAFASSSVSCASLRGSGTSKAGWGELSIGRCTPSGGRGYKSATGLTNVLSPGGMLTWSRSGATTDVAISSNTVLAPGACGHAHVEIDITGSVTGASTAGIGVPAVGDSVTARICEQVHSLKLHLVHGTDVSL
jgi:hypothetical protein